MVAFESIKTGRIMSSFSATTTKFRPLGDVPTRTHSSTATGGRPRNQESEKEDQHTGSKLGQSVVKTSGPSIFDTYDWQVDIVLFSSASRFEGEKSTFDIPSA